MSHVATGKKGFKQLSKEKARHQIPGLSREHDKERNNLYLALLAWRRMIGA